MLLKSRKRIDCRNSIVYAGCHIGENVVIRICIVWRFNAKSCELILLGKEIGNLWLSGITRDRRD